MFPYYWKYVTDGIMIMYILENFSNFKKICKQDFMGMKC